MARGIHPDPAVERAVREVRAVRERIGALLTLARRARAAGRGDEAERILDDFFEGRIGYETARKKLERLAEC